MIYNEAERAAMIIYAASVKAKELIIIQDNNMVSGLGINSIIFFGILAILGGIFVWSARKKIVKEPHILLLNAVPFVIGLLLVLRNLLVSDMFNIGLSLILLSMANILKWVQK